MHLKNKEDYSIVQELLIETDSEEGLKAASMVALIEHKRATHFKVIQNSDGSNTLSVLWHGEGGAQKLPFVIDDSDSLFNLLKSWLEKEGIYPNDEPDIDGSIHRGFKAQKLEFYDVVSLTPAYIIYAK